jgi:hypothetical protein
MNKILKYIKKYNIIKKDIYIKKIAYHLIGGGIAKYNYESIIKLLNDTMQDKDNISKNRYIIILYGPPASGKSLAIDIAIEIIKKYDEEARRNEHFAKSFVNTGVDDIVYNINFDEHKTVGQILKEKGDKFDKCLKNSDALVKESKISDRKWLLPMLKSEKKEITASYPNIGSKQKCINNMENDNKIYFDERPYADILSELIFKFNVALGKNIIFETASDDISYVQSILDGLIKLNYIPIIMYPYVSDINIFKTRSIDRAKLEGRLPTCSFIRTRAISMVSSFYKLIKYIEKQFINFIYIMYDANNNDKNELKSNVINENQNIILYSYNYINKTIIDNRLKINENIKEC